MNYEMALLPAEKYCKQVTDGTHDSPKPTVTGKYLITSKHLSRYKLDFESAYKISIDDYNKVIERSIVNQYDILYSMIGTIGNIYQEMSSHIDYAIKNVGLFKCHNYYESKWLYYYLQALEAKEYVYSNLKGSTQKYISLGALRQMPIRYVADTSIRNKILDILVSLDDKIAKNMEGVETLELVVQTLYRNWFSDYNYPDATGEICESENLHIEVPKEWKEKKFGEFLASYSEKIGDVEAPVYSTTNNGIALRDDKFKKNLSKSQNNNKKIVKDDLIFGLSREILNFGVVTAEIGSVSPVYQIFKIDQTVFLPFMLELEIRINMQNYMDILQLGAREGQSISKDYLLNKYILVPDMKVQKRFEEIYSAIQNKISKLKDENTVLAEIRDTLLPKLMSGELQVEAEVGDD